MDYWATFDKLMANGITLGQVSRKTDERWKKQLEKSQAKGMIDKDEESTKD